MSEHDHDDLKELEQVIKRLSSLESIKTADIPTIDLYMDQVTHFMDHYMSTAKRYEDDKILTKTMINNYTKNKLLPPPVKKKYSRDHMILLIFIYYMKNLLSINDIDSLLTPVSEKYFGNETGSGLAAVYEEIHSYLQTRRTDLIDQVRKEYLKSEEFFKDFEGQLPEEDIRELRHFAYICFLSYDVYIKKMVIETLIDNRRAAEDSGKKGKTKKGKPDPAGSGN